MPGMFARAQIIEGVNTNALSVPQRTITRGASPEEVIVPAYAVVVREYFSPVQAATRISLTITATIFGMALGGWMSGKIFDLTGSYRMAFANGVAWNVLNLLIAYWLLRRSTKLVT